MGPGVPGLALRAAPAVILASRLAIELIHKDLRERERGTAVTIELFSTPQFAEWAMCHCKVGPL